MTGKRYEVLANNDLEISLKDNLTKRFPLVIACENIDDFGNVVQEVLNCCTELNRNWEQTLRFEQYLKHHSEMVLNYEDKIDELKNENRLLKATLKQEEEVSKELEQFKISIIAFAECNENINRRTLNELIEGIDYDR